MSFSYFLLTCVILVLALTPTLFNNPVWSVLAFIAVFLFIVCILLNLNIEFLAFVYAIVYIGAVAVLFLFVVMLLKVSAKYYIALNIYWIIFVASLICMFATQITIIIFRNLSVSFIKDNSIISYDNIYEINTTLTSLQNSFKRNELHDIAAKFYDSFNILFIETAFILLIALIGIIVLVLQETTQYNTLANATSSTVTII